ncbi:MAG TPA: Ldh family oxidoreductase, partial [bacterium]|nr:Ldh family oxidoreductase [bacterium]
TNMNAPGAAGGVIGNNPFAYAVPRGDKHPLMLDMALSTVAAGKVVAALERGEPIPDTWLVDANGRPSTNPADYPTRATLYPMAGYKGYGLALMVEVLAAALTGAAMTTEIHSWTQELGTVTGEGHAFIAINCGAMMPASLFARRMATMTESITGAPRAPGAERIWLPGEKEFEKREEALRSGILLPADVVASLLSMAEELHLQPPAFVTA